ncbi:HAD family hydrolase [Anaerobium acetethylicum]|uniref:Haloacid dehalogenase superfamily, subfamily IA, variant 3 with third motif having DD or ED n=1 Tax=Anaerobium acetethylicum TaxID=1619234 RepID=A0A1D3TNP0_9FIRM|nr:HAD family phosphatase [Anaerobium acetethylicum]SCP94967.1 haloacid dehalogenase superfamily, subfamily IA, variant 3 with third motif having DD or ED [Anaerobium acetethylicum]
MLKNVKTAIFDLDGTLVDSMWMWKTIDIEFLGRYGISLPDDLQKEIEGMGFSETAVYFKDRFGLKESLDEIKHEWNRMAFDKYQNHVPMKKGAVHFLQQLKDNGISLGIATSNSRELAETVAKVHGLDRMFDTIITACDVRAGKPAPDIYLKAAGDLGAHPDHCLVFEDVPMGILAGKNARMRVCTIYDEFSADQEEEKRSLADYYIKDYEDIKFGTYEVLKND